jgi:hypothetical protein
MLSLNSKIPSGCDERLHAPTSGLTKVTYNNTNNQKRI